MVIRPVARFSGILHRQAHLDYRKPPKRWGNTMSNIPINLSGTLAADPQSRTLPSGRACASFRLAVNHWRLNKETGEYVNDSTSWFGIDCYGPLASNCSMSLRQGMSVVVQGNLKIREWSTDEKSGVAPTVVAEHIGPDLRYGTANFQKASSTNRQQEGQHQAGADNDTPWGGLGEDSGGEPVADGAPVLDDPHETESTRHDVGAGTHEDVDTGVPGGESDNDDDAIVRDTMAATAPF